ncbi:hypothetical protein [Chitinophaga sp.]|uniref:hypothetical protein n=1 Tax=Chitinophaga sp. TaxID=1869181 RepID=UPI002CD30619|nr:hypothetical protein [Chitinophaga sp.]HWV69521.1 hypothetical protein [Chitinophaga sp.]
MKSIFIIVPISGKPHTLEFSYYRFDNYVMYDLQGDPPCSLIPERLRVARVLDKTPQLSKIHETVRIDPRVQTYEAKALFFRIVSELFTVMGEEGLPTRYDIVFYCNIDSAEKYSLYQK